MPRHALTLFLSLPALILTSACTTAPSDAIVVSAPLRAYSVAFQNRLAGELMDAGPACDRVEPTQPCSAAERAVLDYLELRDRIRALAPPH